MWSNLKNNLVQRLPLLIIIICALQPLLDITSYWQDQLGYANTLTLILRMIILIAVALLGFIVSDRKRIYYIFALCCALLLAGHCYACYVKGYLNIVYDLTNFVRVAQMPLFVICFISFMRQNERCYKAIKTGLMLNFTIITCSVILSLITGTSSPTYEYSNLGIMGWFATGNAQSAIISLLTPIVVMCAHKQQKLWLTVLVVAASFAQLYFLGARLAFLAIVATAIGIPFVLIVTKQQWKQTSAVLLIGLIICLATVKVSPMYLNQTIYNQEMSSKQGDAMAMIKLELGDYIDIYSLDWDSLSDEDLVYILRVVYSYYQTELVDRYGLESVLQAYNYSHDVTTITGTRFRKIIFCRLLMQEHAPISRVFGMELTRMEHNGIIYDVENDFHGIYFLYGAAGLTLMICFIGYFIFLIIKALAQDAKKYFTLDAGAVGIAFCLALAYAYNTAGVLRRPNSSFYLSIILAVVYYLIKIHHYPEETASE